MNIINIFVALVGLGLSGYLLYPGIVRGIQAVFRRRSAAGGALTYAEFLQAAQDNHIRTVTIPRDSASLLALHSDGKSYWVPLPSVKAAVSAAFLPKLVEKSVSIQVGEPVAAHRLVNALLLVLGCILSLQCLLPPWAMPCLPASWRFTSALPEAPSVPPAPLDGEKLTFADVGGYEELKQELSAWIARLRAPEACMEGGAPWPKGILIAGPQGTGKQLLAEAIAGEANARFLKLPIDDSLSEKQITEAFADAKRRAPCVLCLEGLALGDGTALRQLLKAMDGLQAGDSVLVVATTPEVWRETSPLFRRGRFHLLWTHAQPDRRTREAILRVQTRSTPLEPAVDLARLAEKTVGFSGVKLVELVHESALYAVAEGRPQLSLADFEQALERLRYGLQRPLSILSLPSLERVAVCAAGEAIVARVAGYDPIEKVTLLCRNDQKWVRFLPEEEPAVHCPQRLETELSVRYSARVAEVLLYGQGGTSLESAPGIEEATRLARTLVTEQGFSERLGPVSYREASGESRAVVDAEVKALLDRAYQKAYQLLSEKQDSLLAMKAALLAHGSLNAEQVGQLIDRQFPAS